MNWRRIRKEAIVIRREVEHPGIFSKQQRQYYILFNRLTQHVWMSVHKGYACQPYTVIFRPEMTIYSWNPYPLCTEIYTCTRCFRRFNNTQGAYKLSEYFAKLDDRCILSNELVHTTFGSTSQEDHDVQISVGTRAEPPQIPGHTNYARSVRQPFPSNTGLRLSHEMAVATIGPFQMVR
jgi:hypothetical protein